MKTWIDQLIGFVGRRKRPPIVRRMDWHGRLVATDPAGPPASKDALYATLGRRLTRESRGPE
jgi:hypothetical protein